MGRKAGKKVGVDRSLRTYVYLYDVAYYAMKRAKESKEGEFFECITAMVFSAFCLEAYLNHLGALKIGYWDVLKERLRPYEKLQVLSHVMGYDIDYGRRPFQTLRSIFTFRNQLVHATTEHLSVEAEIPAAEELPTPLAGWEESVTLGMAERFLDDAEAMIKELHSRSGLEGDPLSEPELVETRTRHSR